MISKIKKHLIEHENKTYHINIYLDAEEKPLDSQVLLVKEADKILSHEEEKEIHGDFKNLILSKLPAAPINQE